jgi:hypothetical protein
MFSFFNFFNSNSNPTLDHLDLVLSQKKKLKEKNIEKYYRSLGGNYEIGNNKSLDDSYKLFKLGVKNNISVDRLINKFKGSAPELYSKLERKITKKYMNYSESSGGAGDDDDTEDAKSLLTNLSGVSDIPTVKRYSEDKLPEYAKLDFIIISRNEQNDVFRYKGKFLSPSVWESYVPEIWRMSPYDWNPQDVLIFLAYYSKESPSHKLLYSRAKYNVNKGYTYKSKNDDYLAITYHSDRHEEGETVDPDEELSILFGRDGLLLEMHYQLLGPTSFKMNLVKFLLYWFYYAPTGESLLEKIGWTRLDKKNNDKVVYNPTAGLIMRIIEVLHYINVRYLYPNAVKKIGNCDSSKMDICRSNFAHITNMNRSYLGKLNKIDLSIKEIIQEKMSRGKYSTVFREFYDFKRFNKKDKKYGTPYNRFTFELESCEEILSRGIGTINATYALEGGIKDRRYDYDGGHEDYYNDGNREEYDYDGGREEYDYNGDREEYDYNGGRNRYYPDSMHGGELGLFRNEINRII